MQGNGCKGCYLLAKLKLDVQISKIFTVALQAKHKSGTLADDNPGLVQYPALPWMLECPANK